MSKKKFNILILGVFILTSCQSNITQIDLPLTENVGVFNKVTEKNKVTIFKPDDINKNFIKESNFNLLPSLLKEEITTIQDNNSFSTIVFNNPELMPKQIVFIKKNEIEYQYRYLEEFNYPGSSYCEPCSMIVAKSSKISLQLLKNNIKQSDNNLKWSKKLNELYKKYF